MGTAAIICLCDQNPGLERREQRLVPYLVLLREEFTLRSGFRTTPGGLLPHPFTLTAPRGGGILSVALVFPRHIFRGILP